MSSWRAISTLDALGLRGLAGDVVDVPIIGLGSTGLVRPAVLADGLVLARSLHREDVGIVERSG